MTKPFRRLLLTGAAGGLGRVLRPHLTRWTEQLRVSDLVDCGPATDGEEVISADLGDKKSVNALVAGVDVVLHFGGISLESPFEKIVAANIVGLYNVYEAVHKHNVRRVIYASSSHVVGFYPQTQVIDADAPLRPDCLYGVSKCFGEALTRYYFDRFGIEAVCLRIGSSFAEPANPRMLVTYLSYDDLVELVERALFTPRVDHSIVYGVSDNAVKWWDNRKASHLGFHARDSSSKFASMFPPAAPGASDDPTLRFQGGPWVVSGPIEE
ncbi:MAG: NAD(P)-dependent oxidoreductase [Betaproteobacteria bacterium]